MSGRITCLIFLGLLSLGFGTAHAAECYISGPRYQLRSDTVEWRMQIAGGQTCIRGIRFNNVEFASIKLIAPPQSGRVALLGPAFSYTAKTDFTGEDTFAVAVSGAINRLNGSSTIHVVVSVVSARSKSCQAEPASHDRVPVPAPALTATPSSRCWKRPSRRCTAHSLSCQPSARWNAFSLGDQYSSFAGQSPAAGILQVESKNRRSNARRLAHCGVVFCSLN